MAKPLGPSCAARKQASFSWRILPTYAKLESEFAWERTSHEERLRRRTRAPWMARVSAFSKSVRSTISPSRNKIASMALASLFGRGRTTLSVLDIGCARGALLLNLYEHCAEAGLSLVPSGIEVSREQAVAAQRAMSSVGGKVVFANALEGIHTFEDNSLDLVIMCSFLEHECRPLACLKAVHRVLASDGQALIKVPNFSSWNRWVRGKQWSGFRFPDHVNYFTPKTLKRLACEAGFDVARQTILDRFPLSDNMYAILSKRPMR